MYKKKNIISCMATTRTIVVELSNEVVVSLIKWLFRATTFFLFLLSLSHIIKKIIHNTT
jgi:hypothetical protein